MRTATTVSLFMASALFAEISVTPPRLECPFASTMTIASSDSKPGDKVSFKIKDRAIAKEAIWPAKGQTLSIQVTTTEPDCGARVVLTIGSRTKEIPVDTAALPVSRPFSVEPMTLTCGRTEVLIVRNSATAPVSPSGPSDWVNLGNGSWLAHYSPACTQPMSFDVGNGATRLLVQVLPVATPTNLAQWAAIGLSLLGLTLLYWLHFSSSKDLGAQIESMNHRQGEMARTAEVSDVRRLVVREIKSLEERVAGTLDYLASSMVVNPSNPQSAALAPPPAAASKKSGLRASVASPASSSSARSQVDLLMDGYRSAINGSGNFPEPGHNALILAIANANERVSRGAEPIYEKDDRSGDLIAIRASDLPDKDMVYVFATPDPQKWTPSRIKGGAWDQLFAIEGRAAANSFVSPAIARFRDGRFDVTQKGDMTVTF